jgi:cyclophilin family peptidyl-prolyl cis-trans isomerase
MILPLLLALAGLIAACGQTAELFTYEVRVRDTVTGEAIANAVTRAEIGVRNVYQATTDASGAAHLTIDAEHLGRWAKIIVEADEYQRQSVLVHLIEQSPTATVGLEPLSGAPVQTATPAVILLATPLSEPAPASQTITLANSAVGQSNSAAPRPLADVAPADRADYYQARPELTIDLGQTYQATIRTNKGDIKVLLDAAVAPEHVNNFIFLSNQGFYDGLTFHRVEPGFVIQGGDPAGNGTGGPGYTIPGEFSLKHIEGALAMARQPDEVNPNRESSGSQFYITLAPTEFLDGQYSVFGHVEEGMDVVRSIEIGDTIERVTIEP